MLIIGPEKRPFLAKDSQGEAFSSFLIPSRIEYTFPFGREEQKGRKEYGVRLQYGDADDQANSFSV